MDTTSFEDITPEDSIVQILSGPTDIAELEIAAKSYEEIQRVVSEKDSLRQSALDKLIKLGLSKEEAEALANG